MIVISNRPAAFRWLCVETANDAKATLEKLDSHLRVAVC